MVGGRLGSGRTGAFLVVTGGTPFGDVIGQNTNNEPSFNTCLINRPFWREMCGVKMLKMKLMDLEVV